MAKLLGALKSEKMEDESGGCREWQTWYKLSLFWQHWNLGLESQDINSRSPHASAT